MDNGLQGLLTKKLATLLSNPNHAERATMLAVARDAWERLRAEAKTSTEAATLERHRCRLASIEGGHGFDALLSRLDGACRHAEGAKNEADRKTPAAEARAALARLEQLVEGARARVEELLPWKPQSSSSSGSPLVTGASAPGRRLTRS